MAQLPPTMLGSPPRARHQRIRASCSNTPASEREAALGGEPRAATKRIEMHFRNDAPMLPREAT